MQTTTPHYLLMSETRDVQERPDSGHWRFVLEQIDGSHRIDVSDDEPNVRGERLQLLAVLRGLEALEQPSQVTLITPSRYVGKGLRHGLDFWRENGWCWERFGEMTPIKNRDLWQRIDRSLTFHQIDCRIWNLDRVIGLPPQSDVSESDAALPDPTDAAFETRQKNRRIRFDNACHQIGSMARLFAERFGQGGFRTAYGYA